MVASTLPDEITLDEFHDVLGRYNQTIEAVSSSKNVKPGAKTLAQLDHYRYVEAPTLFGLQTPTPQTMQLEDVQTLVEWKLKHGKFRPTLMKLVSSNDAAAVKDTITEAIESYHKTLDAPAAVDALAKLRGIGPATASLLLAVHDPDKVIFFADEAFYWLCSGARRDPIKYNLKEYRELNSRLQTLANRLNVKAIDVERVAYVLMAETPGPPAERVVQAEGSQAPAKRKQASDLIEVPATRRSKRGKRA